MQLELTDDEERARVRPIRKVFDEDRFPYAPLLDPRKAVLASATRRRRGRNRRRLSVRVWRRMSGLVGGGGNPASAQTGPIFAGENGCLELLDRSGYRRCKNRRLK
jgi:hypothetical protein